MRFCGYQLMNANRENAPGWMKWTLLAAGVYNLLFGSFVILFPTLFFQWLEMEPPRYLELWQCIGMIVGVYGVGYIIAAFDPARHWPIVLVGFLGKLFGPIGFIQALIKGSLPVAFGLANVTNDLIWLVPFGLILHFAYQQKQTIVPNSQAETVSDDQHG